MPARKDGLILDNRKIEREEVPWQKKKKVQLKFPVQIIKIKKCIYSCRAHNKINNNYKFPEKEQLIKVACTSCASTNSDRVSSTATLFSRNCISSIKYTPAIQMAECCKLTSAQKEKVVL